MTRLRVLALIEIITLILMMVLDYTTSHALIPDSQAKTEGDSSALSSLLFYLISWIGMVSQFIGLIGIYKEQRWGKVVFLISVGIAILLNLMGNSETGGSRLVMLLSMVYWLAAGAIIALSYEKQTSNKRATAMIR